MNAPTLDLAAIAYRRRGVAGMMGEVMLALVPGTLLQAWLIDPRVLVDVALAVLAALALEALVLRARSRPVAATLGDGSIALAAWLLALALPPGLPPGQLLVGVAAMVLLGKHLYGGLGHNPFNPAMLGYAVLIVSFPVTMTAWPPSAAGASSGMPGGGATVVRTVSPAAPVTDGADGAVRTDGSRDTNDTGAGTRSRPTDEMTPGPDGSPRAWDAITAATPLDRLRTIDRARPDDGVDASVADGDDGVAPNPGALILSSPWPWVNGGFLIGGLWLLARGVIGWRIPLSLLGTLALLHAVHGTLSAVPQPPVGASLLAGAAMLGAFFIATDPVSAASGPRARLVYGAGIGALTFVLREFGAYPEGIAFAVLLMNATVPVLDRLSGTRHHAP